MAIDEPPKEEGAKILGDLERRAEALRVEAKNIEETVRKATDMANALLVKKAEAEKVAEEDKDSVEGQEIETPKINPEQTDEDLLEELEALEKEVAEENKNITALETEKGEISPTTPPKTAEPSTPTMPDASPPFSLPPNLTFTTPTPDAPPASGAPVNIEAKTKGLTEKIKGEVKRIEAEKGRQLTEQEQQEIVVNSMTTEGNKASKAKLESSSWAKKALAKTLKGWENLDKTKGGRITKGVASAAFIGGSIFAGSMFLGNIPVESASKKLLWRIGLATGINTLMASKLSKKPFSEQKKKALKIALMTGGLGFSFLTGGTAVVAIGAGGIAFKNLFNYITARKIKNIEEKLKKSPEKIKSEHFKDDYDSERFAGKIDEVMREREKLIKSLKWWKGVRGILNGATSITTGFFTAEAFDKQIEAGTANDDSWLSKDAENLLEKPKSWIENMWDKRPEWLKSDSGAKDNSATVENTVENNDTGTKETGTKVENTAVENTAKVISITFDKGEGGIQGIVDLKEQIREAYPDLSKAPENIQEFVRGNDTQQAIDFGFFDPNDPSGKESAGIMSGSTLRFDDDKIIFHDARTDTDQTEYKGKMFDSGHSAEADNLETPKDVTPVVSAEDETIPKDVTTVAFGADETIPKDVTSVGTTETLPEDDVTPVETEGDETIPKDVTSIEQELSKDTTEKIETEDKSITGYRKEETSGYKDGDENDKNINPEELTPQDREILVSETHKGNIDKIFGDNVASWEKMHEDNPTAESMLNKTHAEIKVLPEEQQNYIKYLNKLQRITHLEPRGETDLIPAETDIKFEARALEKAIRDGKIDKVRL